MNWRGSSSVSVFLYRKFLHQIFAIGLLVKSLRGLNMADIKRLSNGPTRPEWGPGRHRSGEGADGAPPLLIAALTLPKLVDNPNYPVYIVRRCYNIPEV